MGLGGFVLGSPILYIKGMRILMFQLSGFHYIVSTRQALIAEEDEKPQLRDVLRQDTLPQTVIAVTTVTLG